MRTAAWKEEKMKRFTAFIVAAALFVSTPSAMASGAVSDHRGTPMDSIEIGTQALSKAVKEYIPIFKSAGEQYGVDPNLLAAICMQESSGRNLSYREDGSEYPAWGIMQIEYTNEKSFAAFGKRTTGVEWTLEDRLDPEKSVPYAAWLISQSLYMYDCDYMKTLQAYNFGSTVLDRIIEDKGDEWLEARSEAKNYVENWSYERYGDAEYIEHVMSYYHNDIEYRCAKVRVNGALVKFDDQAPLIIDGTTLVPIRAVSQMLGADVEWDSRNYEVIIEHDDRIITIPIDSYTAYIGSKEHKLSVPAQIMNGRTMVPLRFIAETFGTDVDWEQDTRTVLITD